MLPARQIFASTRVRRYYTAADAKERSLTDPRVKITAFMNRKRAVSSREKFFKISNQNDLYLFLGKRTIFFNYNLSHSLDCLTIFWRQKPAAVIGGPRKCGTGLIKDILQFHPSVSMVPKEVHYFDMDEVYEKGTVILKGAHVYGSEWNISLVVRWYVLRKMIR